MSEVSIKRWADARCTASLSDWMARPECPMKPPFSGSATCWRGNNSPPQVLRNVNEGLSSKGLLLKTGTLVDANLIAAPSATKNSCERDPEMHQTKKGN